MDIEYEEVDQVSQEYKYMINYPDPRTDANFFKNNKNIEKPEGKYFQLQGSQNKLSGRGRNRDRGYSDESPAPNASFEESKNLSLLRAPCL